MSLSAGNFHGLTVLTLESRRGQELSRLIETYGGKAFQAAAMREVPFSANPELLKFMENLFEGNVDAVVFLTGAGTRALAKAIEGTHPVEKFLAALRKVVIIARGPKPVSVLREWKVPITLAAPQPNTWRELLQGIDDSGLDLRGKNVAVQEYGISNPELLEGLRQRGARVTPVRVYQWALPEDCGPLRAAVEAIIAGRIDVALFTTGVQVSHLFEVAEEAKRKGALQTGLRRVVKASIGPTTSEVLRGYGLEADLQASQPKMGFLVKESAEQSEALVRRKLDEGGDKPVFQK